MGALYRTEGDRPITLIRVAGLARATFTPHVAELPRGEKGRRHELLRRAAVHAATEGRCRRLSKADGEALADTFHLLQRFADEGVRIVVTVGVEVVFVVPGDELRVPWAEVYEATCS